VGTAVTLLPLHHPVHVAEQASLLHRLSGGRFVLGVGRGQAGTAYEVIGAGLDSWRSGLPNALDTLLSTLNGNGVATVIPSPPSELPVYLAANSPSSVALAASHDLPMLLYFDKDANARTAMVALHTERAVRSVGNHAYAVYARVTDTQAEARVLMRWKAERIAVQLSESGRSPVDELPDLHQLTERLLSAHPVGDVEHCVHLLVNGIVGSGCTTVLCQIELDESATAALHHLERLATSVLPEVRRRVTQSREAIRAPG
jgi:alkanesulfonate monooxygenase SsuD/methylene tetrahydromethanopterin reductase-like flavin-dependent oxidoreductase (luciferase family)